MFKKLPLSTREDGSSKYEGTVFPVTPVDHTLVGAAYVSQAVFIVYVSVNNLFYNLQCF